MRRSRARSFCGVRAAVSSSRSALRVTGSSYPAWLVLSQYFCQDFAHASREGICGMGGLDLVVINSTRDVGRPGWAQCQLPFAGKIDGLTEDAQCFLGRMKAGGIF